MIAHLCVSAYEHPKSVGWISPRKLAIHLRLQKFPGQRNHSATGCGRYALDTRSTRALLKRPTIRGNSLHPNPECPFQLEQLCPLLSHEESRSDATLASSSRAANTMNEIFGYIRKVIVNDIVRYPARECRGRPHRSRRARGAALAEIRLVPQFAGIANDPRGSSPH